MIDSISLENFKAFQETRRLRLRPITCIVGRNSSGKSTLLQAIMLLRQSLEHRALGSRLPELNLAGPLFDGGSYRDIVYRHDTSRSLGFTFEMSLDLRNVFGPPQGSEPLIELDVPRIPSRRMFRRFYNLRNEVVHGTTRTLKARVVLEYLPQPPFGPTLNTLWITIDGLGEVLFKRTVGRKRIQHWRSYVKDLPNKTLELFFPRESFLPVVDVRAGGSRRGREALERFVAFSSLAFEEITRFLNDTKVVGPFRTPPARRYAFSGFGALDTGLSGERAVDLLIAENLTRPTSDYLRRAVSYWLDRLQLADGVKVRALAKRANIFEVQVAGAGGVRRANFADVGFGVSQVLPVLVQGLLVRRGGTFLVQQPEIHLHPDAQADLADYFVYLASQGVNSVIETHSEYFLLRLRRRLAEGVRPDLIGIPGEREPELKSLSTKDVSILYVEANKHDRIPREIKIGKAFQFEDMPKGFMNQAIEDRLGIMQALKKQ
jgi:predicted ATPase